MATADSSDLPLPDPDRIQRAARAAVDRFQERRGLYIGIGVTLFLVVVAALVYFNLPRGDDASAFTPLWTKCEAVRVRLDIDRSAAAELDQLESYLAEIRGTREEGLALWFLSIYHYREAWTEDKILASDRRPHLEKALGYLEELTDERFDDLLLTKTRWFSAAQSSPIESLTEQVRKDLAWLDTTDYEPPRPDDDIVAVLRTSAGDIHIQFFRELAPKLSENFLTLCRAGTYNGTAFHFVRGGNQDPRGVMGGDPYSFFYNDPLKKKHILRWGSGGIGYDLPPEESRYKINHVAGIVTSQMRTRAEWNNGVQFQILLAPDRALDRRHSPFGQVVEGMDVVRKCASRKTAAQHDPYQDDSAFAGTATRDLIVDPVIIHKAIVYEKGVAMEHDFPLAENEKTLAALAKAPVTPLSEEEIHGGRTLRRTDATSIIKPGKSIPFPEDADDKADPKGERKS